MTLWRINVAEWSAEQVVDWLKGLDNSMYHYVNSFTNNEVGGQELLSIRPYILEQLGMYSISHQEIVLEAVRLLRNFHFNLDKENLQYLALQVASQAWSLHKQLTYCKDKNVIETNILKEVTSTVATIKPLIWWLDRAPFKGQRQFNEIRSKMLRLGLEMATSAHRDRFADEPVNQIQTNAEKLAKLGDYIIQDISDPMLLQPASLLLVTLKKKESDLGFNLMPDVHGVHKITDIRYNSPAHLSGKIEEGDEIVQINYQTVVGWQHKKVLLQLLESKPDVLLTLKKRPKHMKIYGQIYMKPYRLPSKKRAMHYRWGETLPSPRAELLSINDLPLPLSRPLEKHVSDSESDSNGSDILTPTEPKAPKDLPLFLQKSRPVLQRRNTICGDQTSSFKNLGNVVFWQERKDKSVSFGHGLEIAPRPNTFIALKGSLPEIMSEKCGEEKQERKESERQEDSDSARRSGVSKVVRFDADLEEFDSENNCTFNVDNTVIETFEPIPYADEDELTSLDCGNIEQSHMATKMTPETGVVQAINTALINSKEGRTKRLETCASVSICDSSDDDDDDVPPAIEPRKEFLQTTPPEPPPRPRKNLEGAGGFIKPGSDDVKSKVATVVDLKSREACQSVAEGVNQHRSQPPPPPKLPTMKHFREEPFEALELFTPPKTKGLTLKKKNSILAKRRKVTLKCLTVSDIQGHLYRRTKDKSGAAYWAKGYFVLVDTALYGFKTKDAAKANCLIFLSGFTVSLANEVHSKANAFKVYHASKTFYFAAETPEALGQWMEFIRNATLKGNPAIGLSTEVDLKEIFTETESSDDDSDLLTRGTFSYGGSTSNVMTSSLGKTSQEGDSTPVTTTKHEKYHLGFGSLKKFTKSNLPFSKSEKKPSPDIPTPTAQFRSYRKVVNQEVKPVPVCLEVPQAKAPPLPAEKPTEESVSTLMTKKARRPAPLNYIHASNPNLVDFDFHTSKTIDFSVPKISSTWEGQHSLQGFMTLKDLMLQKQEEDAKEVYNNRVFLGMEKKEERGVRKKIRKNSSGERLAKVHNENPKIDKIQSRSLPKTPDYAQSFKPDDVDIIMTRSKEGLKLRDFGYEFISGDDPQDASKQKGDLEKTWPKRSDKVSPTVTSWSKKKGNWIISTERKIDEEKNARSGGSFKKFKPGKLDNILTTSDKMFSFKHVSEKEAPKTPLKPLEKYAVLKPVSSYSPVSVPHGKKSSLPFGGLPRNDLKENVSVSDARKASVERSASYFTKLSFANTKTPKEKKLLGSPRLHRAIFGRQNSTDSNSIFETITFPATASMNSLQEPPAVFPRTPAPVSATPAPPADSSPPDYTHLEYPPVFEPETYSLSDPSTSLTLLRRRNNKNK
ncbi:uncharacterized protein LOC132259421 [Phlebotomus argentipes]|uniref:uncharacterized protein LOC132259421 n=1 Tax=Phlebotomus argentipes TaxID=94469 RepID=UPI0028932D76|nr:uncharacterized protein LOC132259421 [Phlebotomus argentipes]